MNKLYLSASILGLIVTLCHAQQSAGQREVPIKSKVGYFTSLNVGAMQGDDIYGMLTSSLSGGIVLNNRYRIGGGIGYENHTYWNTVPCFAQAEVDVWHIKKTLAVTMTAQYGGAIQVKKGEFNAYPIPWNYRFDKAWSGRMASAMLGITKAFGSLKIGVKAGLKHQRLFSRYKTDPRVIWSPVGITQEGNASFILNKEDFYRIVYMVTISWEDAFKKKTVK